MKKNTVRDEVYDVIYFVIVLLTLIMLVFITK
jgi:hypothetical protein